MFALFVAFGWKDLERATFSTALRTVHCPDALVAAACSATTFGVSAALEKAQAGKRPPLISPRMEDGPAAPLPPPLHSALQARLELF